MKRLFSIFTIAISVTTANPAFAELIIIKGKTPDGYGFAIETENSDIFNASEGHTHFGFYLIHPKYGFFESYRTGLTNQCYKGKINMRNPNTKAFWDELGWIETNDYKNGVIDWRAADNEAARNLLAEVCKIINQKLQN